MQQPEPQCNGAPNLEVVPNPQSGAPVSAFNQVMNQPQPPIQNVHHPQYSSPFNSANPADGDRGRSYGQQQLQPMGSQPVSQFSNQSPPQQFQPQLQQPQPIWGPPVHYSQHLPGQYQPTWTSANN